MNAGQRTKLGKAGRLMLADRLRRIEMLERAQEERLIRRVREAINSRRVARRKAHRALLQNLRP